MRAFRATVGKRYERCTVPDYVIDCEAQRQMIERIREFGRELEQNIADGVNLILFGPCGSGKDHILAALMKAAMRLDYTMGDQHNGGGKGNIGWVRGADLLADIGQRMFDRDDPWKPTALIRPRILCISDLVPSDGALTAFQQSQLLRIVDSRYCQFKPIWITCNVSSREQLEAALSVPVVDRLAHGALSLFFNWDSGRK